MRQLCFRAKTGDKRTISPRSSEGVHPGPTSFESLFVVTLVWVRTRINAYQFQGFDYRSGIVLANHGTPREDHGEIQT